MEKIKVTTLGSKKLFENKYVTVREDETQWENSSGETATYDYTVITGHNSYVDVIVYDSVLNKYLMVNQYRYAVGKRSWEFTAGYINDGEKPEEAAARELEEEAGVKADKVNLVGKLYQLVGKGDIYGYVYYVDSFKESNTNFDPMENFVGLTADWFTADEINEMILYGENFDANTVGVADV